ncbi:amidohydrolase family protein [Ekhidna sp.]|uniref:N-acyl-D-amino-acid deacylase family protein n=1 Tax=Ekhidna sp. TaxID=2608089 RepID=UPI00329745B6
MEKRKVIMRYSLLLVTVVMLLGCGETDRADMLIKNGKIIDGTGSESYLADVAIRGDSILDIGTSLSEKYSYDNEINADGFIVSPGFIDPHTHALSDLLSDDKHSNLNYLTQGVTTVFVGNDGDGPYRINRYAEDLTDSIGTNCAFLIGHGTVREAVMGMKNESPTQGELNQMKALVKLGMEEGAFGLSSGLFYAPGSFSTTEEVIALAEEVAKFGGIYDTHLRDESTYSIGLLKAVEEAIRIGEEANVAVNLAHIKALGVDVWGMSDEIIEMVEDANDRGIRTTADQYPWSASGTHLENALLNKWVMADGEEAYMNRLNDPALAKQIRSEIKENLRKRGGAESILITADSKDESLIGSNLQEIADSTNEYPVDVAFDIIRNGGCRIASFNMNQSDIENFMVQPWVMTSSDGTNGHPRKYASFPQKYQKYVVERELLTTEKFVHRSTGLTAQSMGISKRGTLKVGNKADIIMWKPDGFKSKADFQNPTRYSEGIHYLIINGEIVIQDESYNKKLAGQVLLKQSKNIE